MRTIRGKPEGWEMPYLPGALIIVPPESTRGKVDRLRRKHDSASAERVTAHITVAQPFRDQPGDEELKMVKQVLAQFEPFRLEYGPLRNFLPHPCIWFDVRPADKVLAIRKALHATGLFNTDLPFTRGFVPHMSITDGAPDAEETGRLFEKLKSKVRGGRFAVSRLVYTRPDWQTKFQVVESLPLGRKK